MGKFPSLALDSAGLPHITYLDWTALNRGMVKYARHDGEEWHLEEIDSLADIEIGFLGARRTTAIALDGQDRPYIAYSDKTALVFGSREGEDWLMEEVTGPMQGGTALAQFVSLEVEEGGRPHLTYYELADPPSSSTGTIYYAVGPVVKPTAILDDYDARPESHELGHNFPNPFNANTVIPFSLPQRAEIEVAAYNLTGQLIRVLERGWKNPGNHETRWDGKDGAGNDVASGVYTVRMVSGDFTRVRKMLLVR